MNDVRPFFTYYGGKWRAAPLYDAPNRDTIIEPFAGSAGYACRYPHRQVRLYDIDPTIVGVWDYLISASETEILRLPTAVENIDDVAAPQEARWLIGFWLNKGMVAPCKTPGKWMRDQYQSDTYWGPKIRQRIASQLRLIRHWQVSQRSWDEVPVEPGTWFVDPPYSNTAGRRYRYSEVDYAALGEWCRSLPGQVIVCEQAGADWLPFEQMATIKTSEGRTREAVSNEVVWLNGEHGPQLRLFADGGVAPTGRGAVLNTV